MSDEEHQAPIVPPFPQDAAVEPGLSQRMARYPRRDTAPEIALRRELHRRGLRYRVDSPLPGIPRRRADILFTRAKVAVFVDGCFWHSCPQHGTQPKNNGSWWQLKLEGNKARDTDTTTRLQADGWTVLRFWEHEEMVTAADQVELTVRSAAARRGRQRPITRGRAQSPARPGKGQAGG